MSEKPEQMREKVLNELTHIPGGPLPQGELRATHWMRRMHSLGRRPDKTKTPREVLDECLDDLRRDYPTFEFQHGNNFFANPRDVSQ